MDHKSKQGWKVMIPHTAINPDARKYLEDRGHTIILYPSRPGVDLKKIAIALDVILRYS